MSLLLLFNGSQPGSIVVGVTPSTSIAGGQRTSAAIAATTTPVSAATGGQRINASIDATSTVAAAASGGQRTSATIAVTTTPTASVSGGQRYNVTITGTTTPTSSSTGQQQRDLPTISPGEYVYAVLLSPSGSAARIETAETLARGSQHGTRARTSTQATDAEFDSPRITYATEIDE